MLSARPRRALTALSVLPLTLSLTLALGAGPAPAAAPAVEAAVEPADARVLAISVDGLLPAALKRLGPSGTPAMHRLKSEGASTLNARTARELTLTLPNHTTMLTGRRVDKDRGGHGVTWNDERPGTTVQQAAGEPVWSIYTRVKQAERSGAMFAGKEKFRTFKRSWDKGIDKFVLETDALRLVKKTRSDLKNRDRAFTFLHLALPDSTGHEHGFMSEPYLDAVRRTDRLIGKLLRAIDNSPELTEELAVILTSDHGGSGTGHYDARALVNHRVPFLVWGRDVRAGGLYGRNWRHYKNPGKNRTHYGSARQPVRNGDLTNLAASLLGLEAVPGSTINEDQHLSVD